MQSRITKVEPIGNSKAILVTDETGKKFCFDVTPYIVGPWGGELANDSYFSKVGINEELNLIVWPNGQDITPDDYEELAIPC